MIFTLYIFLYILLHVYNKLHIFKCFQPFLQQQEKWPLHLKGLLPRCCERVPWWDAPVPSAWCTWTAVALSPSSTKAVLSWLSKCKALISALSWASLGNWKIPLTTWKRMPRTAAWMWKVRQTFGSHSERLCSPASLTTWRRCCSSSLLEVTLLPTSLADCSVNDTSGNTCWSQQWEARKPGPCSAS